MILPTKKASVKNILVPLELHELQIGSEEMGLKVFHWLNRRMHPNTEYCTIHENKAAMEDKEDSVRQSVAEKDTEALLLRDVLLNGILAIGTLGHHVDSLCPEACIEEDDFLVMDEEVVVEEEKNEEEPRNEKVKEDAALAIALSEPVVPVVEPAKMHSSSMKEDNFSCFVTEEILMHEVEDGGAANIQERPLLMVEKVEKGRRIARISSLLLGHPLRSLHCALKRRIKRNQRSQHQSH
ncbi:protein TILLER ANGLE CONTROL 1-like isoform X6 [Panicum virgatum]|uniref:protein TILLER ANGLE CONTROL 1-like isoform X6 n=1 Tax=Panicum virgatum TaxID=38727 RepID=UPI0019D51789|nr:protein TILLER ANGLE CONTROL 1-like isoform X6 [Panicum virgatum]